MQQDVSIIERFNFSGSDIPKTFMDLEKCIGKSYENERERALVSIVLTVSFSVASNKHPSFILMKGLLSKDGVTYTYNDIAWRIYDFLTKCISYLRKREYERYVVSIIQELLALDDMDFQQLISVAQLLGAIKEDLNINDKMDLNRVFTENKKPI